MIYIGKYFGFDTYYLDIELEDFKSVLPVDNWFCCAIAKTDYDITKVELFIRTAIDRGILSWHGLGKFGESLHLNFDFLISEMEVNENHPEVNVCTCGMGEENIEEEFWSCFGTPCLPGTIDDFSCIKLICVSFDGNDYKNELKALISKFNDGYLP
jgi:hypothetical protein